MKSYGEAKLKLFSIDTLSTVVVNLDDPFSQQVISIVAEHVDIIGVSLLGEVTTAPISLIKGRIVSMERDGMRVSVDTPWGIGQFFSHLLAEFNANNLLLALAVSLQQKMPLDEALEKLAKVKAPAGRLESFTANHYPLVVVDYAHTPDALEKVLVALKHHAAGKLWVLFGCGGDRDRGKRSQMGSVAEKYADKVWITDDNPRTESSESIISDIMQGIKNIEAVRVETARDKAIREIISAAAVNDIVLIAGKGHEEYQIIGDHYFSFSDRKVVTEVLGEAA